MMMECPRCGFAQPKDRYCASCGLDVDHYVAKPTPLLSRIVQNPGFHLSLIGAMVLLVVGYIVYSQRDLVSREMGQFLKGLPLQSSESGDPNAPPEAAKPSTAARSAVDSDFDNLSDADDSSGLNGAPPEPSAPAATSLAATSAGTSAETSAAGASTSEKADRATDKILETQKLEFSSWEIPREALSNLLIGAEKASESNGGRAYFWSQGKKVIDLVQSAGRRLALSRSMPLQMGAEAALETPSTPNPQFQFGLYLQILKSDGKDVQLKWDSNMVMPSASDLAQVTITGNATITAASALLIVLEAPNRSPKEDIIVKAGDGPWSVLNSPSYHEGLTEWVVLVQLH